MNVCVRAVLCDLDWSPHLRNPTDYVYDQETKKVVKAQQWAIKPFMNETNEHE
jgi:hypothetical protein